jgi:hypothetical protein
MFRASLRPSSGVLKTVTVTSGIGHNISAATSFQRGLIRGPDQTTLEGSSLIRPRWKKGAVPILLPIPEVVVTDFSTPDDGRSEARNM